MGDRSGAIERYEAILKNVDETNTKALSAIAKLQEQEGNPKETAAALERLLEHAPGGEKLEVARRLADLNEGPLNDAEEALRFLTRVREIDDEDYDALERL
jgi:tetratricopeptide (TPR) repeat protein